MTMEGTSVVHYITGYDPETDHVGEFRNERSGYGPTLTGWVKVSLENPANHTVTPPLLHLTPHEIEKRKRKRAKGGASDSSKQAAAGLVEGHVYFLSLHDGYLDFHQQELPTTGLPPIPILRLSLADVFLSLHPEQVPVSQMFNRKFPIRIRHRLALTSSYLLYFVTSACKEDWYLALKLASKMITTESSEEKPLQYPTAGHRSYMNQLQKAVEVDYVAPNPPTCKPLPAIAHGDPSTQWLNAFVGRIFMAARSSDGLTSWMDQLVTRRLQSIKLPNSLGPMEVHHLVPGDQVPLLYNAKLLRITEEGEVEVSMDVVYQGGFTLEVETTAKLETGITSLEIPLVLSIQVASFGGKLLLRMRPPPSNRIWYGFYAPGPSLSLKIHPLVSDTSVHFGIITQAIEKRILDSLKEEMVLPQMNSLVIPGMEHQDLDREWEEAGFPGVDDVHDLPRKVSESYGLSALLLDRPDTCPKSRRNNSLQPEQGRRSSSEAIHAHFRHDSTHHFRHGSKGTIQSLKVPDGTLGPKSAPSSPPRTPKERWRNMVTARARNGKDFDETPLTTPMKQKAHRKNQPQQRQVTHQQRKQERQAIDSYASAVRSGSSWDALTDHAASGSSSKLHAKPATEQKDESEETQWTGLSIEERETLLNMLSSCVMYSDDELVNSGSSRTPSLSQ